VPGQLIATSVPGTFTVTRTAVDRRGNAASASFTYTVTNPASIPPQLSGVGLSSKSFVAKKGTTLSLNLSKPATVKVVITQRVSGRKVNGHCKPGAKKGKPCTATLKRRTLTFNGTTGINHFKLRTKGLRAGRYKLIVTATTATGLTSNQVALSFKIK
jgi:hypothetical protein